MSYENIVTVANINFHAEWGNKTGNLARIKEYIQSAAEQGAKIILFPEMALTGYNIEKDSTAMQIENAETIPGPAANELALLAQKHNAYIIVGMPERDAIDSSILYNTALVVGPGGIVGAYRKIHPVGHELLWATKGNDPLLFDTPWGPVGIGICFDTYTFPEVVRYYAALGSRLYLNPTASAIGWEDSYFTQLKARVIENALFIMSSNLVGYDCNLSFSGESLIIGPSSSILSTAYYAKPAGSREELQVATLNLSLVDKSRQMLTLFGANPLTGSPDWRPEIYEKWLFNIRQNFNFSASAPSSVDIF
ncbi:MULTISPECIES: carbon-nitrogen hydrolase family protein [unclassified Paenibacillus]|uniref:carbon-nitrogen hydrolase family protein n=1 Tax=unclassified Paenibacillus TaxID=185978 RepID=UPI0024B9AB9E|nr:MULTISPECIES: carbon-nitrogen hydrolase family protein [unclassified Paenibacillus]